MSHLVGQLLTLIHDARTLEHKKTNKIHTFLINELIQLQCLRHVSNVQVFILRKTCTFSFMVFLPCIRISSVVDGRMCSISKDRYLVPKRR
jgi:hypothetical protein